MQIHCGKSHQITKAHLWINKAWLGFELVHHCVTFYLCTCSVCACVCLCGRASSSCQLNILCQFSWMSSFNRIRYTTHMCTRTHTHTYTDTHTVMKSRCLCNPYLLTLSGAGIQFKMVSPVLDSVSLCHQPLENNNSKSNCSHAMIWQNKITLVAKYKLY